MCDDDGVARSAVAPTNFINELDDEINYITLSEYIFVLTDENHIF